MTRSPLHDWLRPRLQALLREATAAGFARDAAVAVVLDLASGPSFDTAPAPAEPAPEHPWIVPEGEDDCVDSLDVGAHVPKLLGKVPGRP